jgi:hypothetical protein
MHVLLFYPPIIPGSGSGSEPGSPPRAETCEVDETGQGQCEAYIDQDQGQAYSNASTEPLRAMERVLAGAAEQFRGRCVPNTARCLADRREWNRTV